MSPDASQFPPSPRCVPGASASGPHEKKPFDQIVMEKCNAEKSTQVIQNEAPKAPQIAVKLIKVWFSSLSGNMSGKIVKILASDVPKSCFRTGGVAFFKVPSIREKVTEFLPNRCQNQSQIPQNSDLEALKKRTSTTRPKSVNL